MQLRNPVLNAFNVSTHAHVIVFFESWHRKMTKVMLILQVDRKMLCVVKIKHIYLIALRGQIKSCSGFVLSF